VETERLIERLAADLRPVSPQAVPRRIALTALAGGGLALAAVVAWLGLRHDLASAVTGPMFWMKAGYAAVLGAAGFWCAERLARPAGSPRRGAALALAAVAVIGALGAAALMTAEPSERAAVWLGHSWRLCPVNILALSLPTLACALWAIRRFAPTRLRLSGAAAGLFAGGVGAAIYGLHCNETSPMFLATWYSLGMALSAGLGALLGPWALRWR
jgi:hypothetical protein